MGNARVCSRKIVGLKTGKSLVIPPTNWFQGDKEDFEGKCIEPRCLNNDVLWMRTRLRKGSDAGRTIDVIQ